MPTGQPALIEFLRATIQRDGPQPFRWFMEQALYHPAHGYYSSGRAAIGRHGDYYTNVSVGPLFGRLLAAQFAEMWERLGQPDAFEIVEQGANSGDFARDVLTATRERFPEFFAALRYEIIEPFAILRERQNAALPSFGEKVRWVDSLDDLAPFVGVHFSNELLDAMPVHLIVAREQWQERHVALEENEFVFRDGPISTRPLQQHLAKIPWPLPSGYETEINLAVLSWIDALGTKLERGFVLAVDYGHARADFYAPERITGTLRAYAKHRVVESPFEGIGETDLTAHVDWTSLTERAVDGGLSINGFTDQHHFLTGLTTQLLPHHFDSNSPATDRRALQTLLHPGLLGRTFQFLALSKNTPAAALGGFKFARAAHTQLGN